MIASAISINEENMLFRNLNYFEVSACDLDSSSLFSYPPVEQDRSYYSLFFWLKNAPISL